MSKWIFLVPVIFTLACSKAKTPEPLPPVKQVVHYETTIKRIVNNNCISCHDAGSSFPLDAREKIIPIVKSGQLLGALNTPLGQESPYLHMPPYYTLLQTDIDSIQFWQADSFPD